MSINQSQEIAVAQVGAPSGLQGDLSEEFARRQFVPLRSYRDVSDERKEFPWGKKVVISFDGGGIRGYASLLIMKALMEKVKEVEEERSNGQCSSLDYPWMDSSTPGSASPRRNRTELDDFLPCHYFDYMAGTSTGGLTAIMLGRLRMTVDEALEKYTEFGNAVFGRVRWFHERSALWWPRAKFASRKTRAAFQKIVFDKLHDDTTNLTKEESERAPFVYREDRTRTMVFSFCINKKGGVEFPWLWRSYDHELVATAGGSETFGLPMNPSTAHTNPIWQIARATSSAPRYFESIKIDGKKHLDGGMCCNNPSINALKEVRRKHGYSPDLFVSIGTGLKAANTEEEPALKLKDFMKASRVDDVRRKQFLKKYLEIGHHWRQYMTDCEGETGTNGWYSDCDAAGVRLWHRLNVEGSLAEVPLDDWQPANSGDKTLKRIKEETAQYLAQETIQARIEEIAKALVEIRVERAMTERWEEFATEVIYRCPHENCRTIYPTRDKLRQHLMNGGYGSVTDHQCEQLLWDGRRAGTSS
ncbi:FabD/lysophospholipase-like protein [Thozetella sp. PMI_491]|nr:FabD/lysophospholipase-like protein [Thozetella sp. PMI_491]